MVGVAPGGAALGPLGLQRSLRLGARGRHLPGGVLLRVLPGAGRGGLGFFGRHPRQIEDQLRQRFVPGRVGHGRFERGQADVERGVAPLTIDDLPIGPHTVVLKSSQGSVERRVNVTAGGTVDVEEAIYAGWLRVTSTIGLDVSEGTQAVALNEENATLMPPGPQTLIFQNRELGYRVTREVVITPGETMAISIVPAKSTLTVAATLPSQVFIDGELAGETPLTDRPIDLGSREIRVRSQTGIERRFNISVGARPARVDADFSKP